METCTFLNKNAGGVTQGSDTHVGLVVEKGMRGEKRQKTASRMQNKLINKFTKNKIHGKINYVVNCMKMAYGKKFSFCQTLLPHTGCI